VPLKTGTKPVASDAIPALSVTTVATMS
jgi:hypothetical protein